MDVLVWGFEGMRHMETFIAVTGGTVISATRGPIIDRWQIIQHISPATEDAHDQAMRDTVEAERDGQTLLLPPTRVPLTAGEAESLTDPLTPAVSQKWINDMIRRGMAVHLRSGLET